MYNSIYNLPEIKFVGGETQNLIFHFEKNTGYCTPPYPPCFPYERQHNIKAEPFNTRGYNVWFSVISYANKSGSPIITIQAHNYDSDDYEPYSAVQVIIPSDNTKNLFGKYVYQISVIDEDNKSIVEIPGQGILDIRKNIDPSAKGR